MVVRPFWGFCFRVCMAVCAAQQVYFCTTSYNCINIAFYLKQKLFHQQKTFKKSDYLAISNETISEFDV